jgi:hypothetical protein
VIRSVRVGEQITLDGGPALVTPDMINESRWIVLANIGGEELAPIVVLRVGSAWRVDAAPIIERRRARRLQGSGE